MAMGENISLHHDLLADGILDGIPPGVDLRADVANDNAGTSPLEEMLGFRS